MNDYSKATVYSIHSTSKCAPCAHLDFTTKEGLIFLERFCYVVRYSLRACNAENILDSAKTGLDHSQKPTQGFPNREHEIRNLLGSIAKLPVNQCSHCFTNSFSSRIHVCLSCVHIACISHCKQHLNSLSNSKDNHNFALDMENLHVFCQKCNNYIYHVELDRIRQEELRLHQLIIHSIRQNWHLDEGLSEKSWAPSAKQADIISKNSKSNSSNGLVGLKNMGNTCFMSTVLQVLIHNPFFSVHFLSDGHVNESCIISACLSCEMNSLFKQAN